jgi:hypothetical protein
VTPFRRLMNSMMRRPEEPKTRTYHDLECDRLRGGMCDCEHPTTITPPTHYTAIDGIRYSYERGKLTKIIDAGFVKVMDGNDVVDEYALGEGRYGEEEVD